MPQPTPENITAFEEQIETSLDYHVEKLREVDKEKSRTLKTLQEGILAEVRLDRDDKKPGAQKYSDDLRITEAEFEDIFKTLKEEHVELLKDNDIEDVTDLFSFMGCEYYHEKAPETVVVEYIKQEVFKKKVILKLPAHVSSSEKFNYNEALKEIEKRKDMEPYIKSGMPFFSLGNARLEFTIEKNGKKMKYSANPEGVFRVMSEWWSSGKRKRVSQKLESLRGQISKLNKQYSETIKQDRKLTNRQTDELKSMLMGGIEKFSEQELIEMMKKKNIPKRYHATIIDIRRLHVKYVNYEERHKETRILYDEEYKTRIKEQNDLTYSSFDLIYLSKKGKPAKKVHYADEKINTEFYNENGTRNRNVNYLGNGKILNTEFYNENGSLDRDVIYSGNGKIHSVSRGGGDVVDRYDKEGEKALYRIVKITERQVASVEHTEDEDNEVNILDKHNLMYAKNGELFGTFDYTKQFHSEMTESSYLDYLAVNLDTPEKLHTFFWLFMEYTGDDEEIKLDEKEDYYVSRVEDEDFQINKETKIPKYWYNKNLNEPGDNWQMSGETICRIKEGKMLGDCDDYAFLARDILRRQGKKAYVMGIPSHAICTWFDKGANGNWNAYSMGTFGFDKNGNRYGRKANTEKEKGYPTLKKALDSLMPKYEKGGKGLKKGVRYRVGKEWGVEILEIDLNGQKMLIDIPIDMLQEKTALDDFIALKKQCLSFHNTKSADERAKILMQVIDGYKRLGEEYPAYTNFLDMDFSREF